MPSPYHPSAHTSLHMEAWEPPNKRRKVSAGGPSSSSASSSSHVTLSWALLRQGQEEHTTYLVFKHVGKNIGASTLPPLLVNDIASFCDIDLFLRKELFERKSIGLKTSAIVLDKKAVAGGKRLFFQRTPSRLRAEVESSVDLFWDGMVRGEVRTGSRMAYEYGSSPADAVVLHFQCVAISPFSGVSSTVTFLQEHDGCRIDAHGRFLEMLSLSQPQPSATLEKVSSSAPSGSPINHQVVSAGVSRGTEPTSTRHSPTPSFSAPSSSIQFDTSLKSLCKFIFSRAGSVGMGRGAVPYSWVYAADDSGVVLDGSQFLDINCAFSTLDRKLEKFLADPNRELSMRERSKWTFTPGRDFDFARAFPNVCAFLQGEAERWIEINAPDQPLLVARAGAKRTVEWEVKGEGLTLHEALSAFDRDLPSIPTLNV